MEKRNEKMIAFFKERGITQESIAAQLGVSQAYVSALMSGKKAFGKKQAQKWNELFGLSVNWLLTGNGNITDTDITPHNQKGYTAEPAAVTHSEQDYLDIIKLQAGQLTKSQEQIDRLLTIIENISC